MHRPALLGASYILAHAPSSLLYQGSMQRFEREKHGESEYLKSIPAHLRSFEDVVAYLPNQVFIGNRTVEDLRGHPRPWFQHRVEGAVRSGPLGEILTEAELYASMKAADSFGLVWLTEAFADRMRAELAANQLTTSWAPRIQGAPRASVEEKIRGESAVPLILGDDLVGCVRRAHEVDEALSAEVMFENLASKAMSALAAEHVVRSLGVDKSSIEFVVDSSEEAVGDVNQRGGGNLAKAVAELAGLTSASGYDVRAFCAAPVHAVVSAAALVEAGVYRTVAVVGGCSVPKLGMNAREHMAKGIPILEDMLAGFAVMIGPSGGDNPVIRTDLVGRLRLGAGSSPKATFDELVFSVLDRAGWSAHDVDRVAGEVHNSEITEYAGVGDVAAANYKMIAAVAVKRGQLEQAQMKDWVEQHGVPGFAPTQGHIPSAIPFLGHARRDMLAGRYSRVMCIGKGSLFLGRMTNVFDGVSIVIEAPSRRSPGQHQGIPRIGVTTFGAERGAEEVARGIEAVSGLGERFQAVLVGPRVDGPIRCVVADNDTDTRTRIDHLFAAGEIDAIVAMHYPFPLGTATVGRVEGLGGRVAYIACTTGAAASSRVEAMLRGAVYGVAVAKAMGVQDPSVGALNVDGALLVESGLRRLVAGGWQIRLAESIRADGGCILRGNDVLACSADVIVTDSLTGNVLIKMISARETGGQYETIGCGYGPGVGPNMDRLVLIVSRASSGAVVTNAVMFAAELVRRDLRTWVQAEVEAAGKAGLKEVVADLAGRTHASTAEAERACGDKALNASGPLVRQIHGVDPLRTDEAVETLGANGIQAAVAAGCTGIVIMVSESDYEKAVRIVDEQIKGLK